MKSQVFAKSDQDMFSRLSGDYNPLQTDPVLARRLIFGKQVVHGVHLLLEFRGIYYLFIGLLKWPFRYDWIRKLKIKSNWI